MRASGVVLLLGLVAGPMVAQDPFHPNAGRGAGPALVAPRLERRLAMRERWQRLPPAERRARIEAYRARLGPEQRARFDELRARLRAATIERRSAAAELRAWRRLQRGAAGPRPAP